MDQVEKITGLAEKFRDAYGLSKAETRVLVDLLHGKTNKQISESSVSGVAVGISTVKRHVEAMYRKMHVHRSRGLFPLVIEEIRFDE